MGADAEVVVEWHARLWAGSSRVCSSVTRLRISECDQKTPEKFAAKKVTVTGKRWRREE